MALDKNVAKSHARGATQELNSLSEADPSYHTMMLLIVRFHAVLDLFHDFGCISHALRFEVISFSILIFSDSHNLYPSISIAQDASYSTVIKDI